MSPLQEDYTYPMDSTANAQHRYLPIHRGTYHLAQVSPLADYHLHYTSKAQQEQAEQQAKAAGKYRGMNFRQREQQERLSEFTQVYKLLEIQQAQKSTQHTMKYESGRVGELSGFQEADRVLEARTAAKDREATQRMKEQLDNVGQSVATKPTDNLPFQLPKLHDGDENTCPQCLDDFNHQDDVTRVACRHIFHASCCDQLHTNGYTKCPACDGDITPIKRWKYIGIQPITQPTKPSMTYHPPSNDSPKPINSHDYVDNPLLQTPPPSAQKSPTFLGQMGTNAEMEPHNAVMTITPMPEFPIQSETLNTSGTAHTIITVHPEQAPQQSPINRSNQSTPKQSYPVYSDQVEDEPGL